MAVADLPRQQTAVIAGSSGDFEISTTREVPSLEPGEILIKTSAVALNPIDTKLVGPLVTPGCTFGFDCAGIVVAIDPAVKRTDIKLGDRVCGVSNGMNKNNPTRGAFAQYVKLLADLTLKVPESMSNADAASLGTAVASACMVLFWSLGWPLDILDGPKQEESVSPVLVYGGSTACGTMVLQLLKLCGIPTITTCSPHNFRLVKSYGADKVYDYRQPDCAQRIRSDTGNLLECAIDCFAADESMRCCYDALGRAGGEYIALNPYNELFANRKAVTPKWILATLIGGEGSPWPPPFAFEPDTRIRELSVLMFGRIQQLLSDGKLRAHPISLEDGGLQGIPKGAQKIRNKEISGQKLIYNLA